MTTASLDRRAIAAATLTSVMAAAYVATMHHQSDRPETWFLALLLLGAGTAAYGAHPDVPRRRTALVLAAGVLVTSGVLAILTMGAPVLAAGLICISAAGTSKSLTGGEAARPGP